MPPDRFRLGEFDVEPGLNRLSGPKGAVKLEPRVMELLVYLSERRGETVPREQLLTEVWGGAAVVDAALSKAVSQLRFALGDERRSPRYVLTVPRRGYRLVAEVAGAEHPTRTSTGASAERRRAWPSGVASFLVFLLGVLLPVDRTRPGAADASTTPIEIRSLAILPFADLSREADGDYIAAGLTEELITGLGRLRRPRVIAPTSARRAAGRPPLRAAADLSADAVITGSVLQDGGRIRVSSRLLTRTGEVLWAASYDAGTDDFFDLIRQLTGEIVDQVRTELSVQERRRLSAARSVDPEAFRLYLRARYFWSRRTASGLEKSRDLLLEAIGRDPAYASAHAALATVYLGFVNYSVASGREAFPLARRAAEDAVRLDPELPEAHAALAYVLLNQDWDLDGAEEAYRRARELGPGVAEIRQLFAECLSIRNRHPEAIAEIERAFRLDPDSPVILGVWGLILNAAGRHTEALARLEEALEMEPRFAWIHRYRAFALTRLGREPEALRARLDEITARGRPTAEMERAHRRIATRGMAGYYQHVLAEDLPEAGGKPRQPVLLAEAHAGLGEVEAALRFLDLAAEGKSEFFLHLRSSPAFDRLKENPRYREFLARIGLDGGAPSKRFATPRL